MVPVYGRDQQVDGVRADVDGAEDRVRAGGAQRSGALVPGPGRAERRGVVGFAAAGFAAAGLRGGGAASRRRASRRRASRRRASRRRLRPSQERLLAERGPGGPPASASAAPPPRGRARRRGPFPFADHLRERHSEDRDLELDRLEARCGLGLALEARCQRLLEPRDPRARGSFAPDVFFDRCLFDCLAITTLPCPPRRDATRARTVCHPRVGRVCVPVRQVSPLVRAPDSEWPAAVNSPLTPRKPVVHRSARRSGSTG